MQQRSRTLPIVAVALVALAAAGIIAILVSGGSGGGSAKKAAVTPPSATGPSVVRAQLSDYKIKPSAAEVPAGKVTFVAGNAGDEEHEMVVVRTPKPAGSLLKGKEADETGAAGEVEEVAAGKSKKLTLNLKPGHYVLLCNLPGHYKLGMRTDFTVK